MSGSRPVEEITTLPPPRRRQAHDPVAVPALTILGHPDPALVGARALLPSLNDEAGAGVAHVSRLEPNFACEEGSQVLLEPNISRRPVVLRGGPQGVEVDVGSTTTAVSLGGSPVSRASMIPAAMLESGVPIVLADRIVLLLHWHVPAPDGSSRDTGLLGDSAGVRTLRSEIDRVADADVPVLICGETGTGKELVARALHRAGPRAAAPFVAVNLAALPPSMAASQLFGHARGAFSGAERDHQGFIEQAHGGTLFLDEIGESSAEVQTMLLRAIEDWVVRPLGSTRTVAVDVRLLTATDVDLDDAVRQGEFRAPLYHRLAGYRVDTPPLRQRMDDLGRLLYEFLAEEADVLGYRAPLQADDPAAAMWLPPALVAELCSYHWPGNVRELRNVARRLAVLGKGRPVVETDAGLRALLAGNPDRDRVQAEVRFRPGSEVRDDELVSVLARCGWQTTRAARELGVSKRTLYRLIDKCDSVRTAKDLGADEIATWRDLTGGDVVAMADGLKVSVRGLKLRMTELGL